MSKYTVNVLCPSGHRRKVSVNSNSNLLQVLENVCHEEDLDSSEWGLMYQRNKCDLTKQWRLLSIPTNATLEMYKLDLARKSDDVHVQLQLPDNSRYTGWFEPTVTLQEMLDWYRIQPESMVAALDISLMGNNNNSCPVCSYLSEEIIGDYALSNTTLRELGLTSGTAVIRYNLRPVSDSDLQKINGRIDEKLVRRRQQQHEREEKSNKPPPPPAQPASPSRSLMNSMAPTTTTNEEHSIFRDPPPRTSLPAKSTSQNQSKTVAEVLGLNFSLDLENERESRNSLQNFKFPQATKGKDLYRNELEDDYRRAQNEKPCERRPIAYDLIKTRPQREQPSTRTEQLPDSFYELTADDLRSVLRTLQQQHSTTEKPLETSSMRERAQSARTMTYEQIALRLVIDDHYILQGFFRPQEPLSRLLDFARQTLICSHIDDEDFYFYTTPPRVILSDLRKPFSAYDLAPAAFVHLGHRTVSTLQVRLTSNVPIRSIDEANQLAAQYVFNRARPVNERERSSLYSDRPVSATSLTPRTAPRNPVGNSMDDKQLREKLRKFLPGKK